MAVPRSAREPTRWRRLQQERSLRISARALKRVNGELQPSVTRDTDIKGFALVVTARRAFWCLYFQPKGLNPTTGKRWGGGMRLELGDAFAMSLADARAAALSAKALVRQGRDPLRERMAATAAAVAARATLPETSADALDAYLKGVEQRQGVAANTRRLQTFYARKAIAELKAERLPLPAIDEPAIRLMLERVASPTERWHLFSAVRRFLGWARKRKLIDHNPCDDLDADDRPDKPRSRDNAPTLAVLRAVWNALEHEPPHARDMGRFLLLMPLRRSEAATLTWADVDLAEKRISIPGARMKTGERHELPLSPAAIELLARRKQSSGLVFGTAAGKVYTDWGGVIDRLRKAIGQGEATKETRFTWHDVRRAFVSHLAGRFDVDLLDQCLGHTRKGVFAIYQRSARWPERAAALNVWAAMVTGKESEPSNVVPLTLRAAG
jgi:integrase